MIVRPTHFGLAQAPSGLVEFPRCPKGPSGHHLHGPIASANRTPPGCPAAVAFSSPDSGCRNLDQARPWGTTVGLPVAFEPDEGYNGTDMMTLDEIREILQAQKPHLAERYGVTEIGVFGSYVRGEQRSDSDLDILVELERPPRISLLGLVELEYYLSDVLGVKADVAIKKNLRKRIGKRILSEVVPV
jgi:predicted nucleotidyltransferase